MTNDCHINSDRDAAMDDRAYHVWLRDMEFNRVPLVADQPILFIADDILLFEINEVSNAGIG